MRLTGDQKQFFHENGYLIIPNLLTADQLVELRNKVDEVLKGTLKPETDQDDFLLQMEPAIRDNPGIPREQKIRVAFNLCHNHTFFMRHVTRPEITDVVEDLFGSGLRLYTDQLFVKPAHHGSAVPFHQDSAYWPQVEPNLISCWVALDDSTIENGCVRVLPGTHKQAIPHSEFAGNQRFGLLEDQLNIENEIPIEIKAGGAMFHHSLTVHRSYPNHSDHGRRGFVSIYMPEGIQFYRNWGFEYGFQKI